MCYARGRGVGPMGDSDNHENDGLTVRELRKQVVAGVRDFGIVIAAIVAAGTYFWQEAKGHLLGFASLPEMQAAIHDIQSSLDELKRKAEIKSRPVVEFRGAPKVHPEQARPGEAFIADFLLRRNEDCSGTIVRRWRNVKTNRYVTRFQTKQEVQRAEVTADFRLWPLELTVPPGMPPGLWAYHPDLIRGSDCISPMEVVIPPAYIEVLPDAD